MFRNANVNLFSTTNASNVLPFALDLNASARPESLPLPSLLSNLMQPTLVSTNPAVPMDHAANAVPNPIMDLDSLSDKFQFHGKRLHLTYPAWINLQGLIDWLPTVLGTTLKWYSACQEQGATGHHHTHVAFETVETISFRSARKLDYLGLHPMMKKVKTQLHVNAIWKYHQKAPLSLLQSEFCPIRDPNSLLQALSAPSLLAAAELMGIAPRTVNCLKILRSEYQTRQLLPVLPLARPCYWVQTPLSSFRVVWLYGLSGTGKTRWAIAAFKSPLIVTHLEALKKFTPDLYDGILFDDICLSSMEPQVMIQLLDWEMPRCLDVKYGSVTIPAGTKRIVTSNLSIDATLPGANPEILRAIKRRCQIIYVDQPLYSDVEIPLSATPLTPPPTPVERSLTLPPMEWKEVTNDVNGDSDLYWLNVMNDF